MNTSNKSIKTNHELTASRPHRLGHTRGVLMWMLAAIGIVNLFFAAPVQAAGKPKRSTSTCSYSISPPSASFASGGGSGSVTVSSGTGCGWSASANNAWITVASGSSGSGNGTVTYSVAANGSTSSRTGTMTIAGNTFTVSQQGASGGGGGGGGSGGSDVPLSNGAPYNDSLTASAPQTGWKYYYIDVPGGSSSALFEVLNMSADVDLYVRYNAQPTLSSFDCRPYIGGTYEQCTFNAPAAGRWWIGVNNYSVGTIGYTVKATVGGGAPAADTTAPIVPNGLWASAASSSQINLSWNPTTDGGGSGLAGYIVYRFGAQIGTTAGTSFQSTGLSPGSTYCYTVAAYDNAGNISGQSGQACATTSAGGDTVPPSANLTSPANGATVSGTITIWADASDNVGVSRVDFYRDGGFIGSRTAAPYSFPSDTSAIPNGSHYFTCIAYDAVGNSTTSANNWVTVNNGSTGTAGQLQWAKPMPCINGDAFIQAVASDHAGNAVAVGYFKGTITVGPYTFTSSSSFYLSALIVKYDAQGNVVWAKPFGSNGAWNGAYKVAIDSQDNVIVVGNFQGTMDFGAGSLVNGSAGYEIFVVKYSPTGVCRWSKAFPGATYGPVAVDGSDNVVVAPGISYTTANFDGIMLSTTGASDPDIALVKLSTSSGAVLWAKRYGGPNTELAAALAVDRFGDIVLTGNFQTATDLGGGTMASAGGVYDIFLAKFSTDGNYKWARRFGGSGTDMVKGLAVDPNTANVVITGGFSGSVDFGSGLLGSSGGIFLAAYDPSGLINLWTKVTGSGTSSQGYAVSIDASGRLALSGTANSAINFGTWPQDPWFSGNGQSDAFVVSFTISGNLPPVYRWTKVLGTGTDGVSEGSGVAISSSGEILAGGRFANTVDFGGTSATAGMSGYYSGFLAKYTH